MKTATNPRELAIDTRVIAESEVYLLFGCDMAVIADLEQGTLNGRAEAGAILTGIIPLPPTKRKNGLN
jgi:hypothetical protein